MVQGVQLDESVLRILDENGRSACRGDRCLKRIFCRVVCRRKFQPESASLHPHRRRTLHARCRVLLGPNARHSRGKMDLRVPPSLHLSTLITTLPDREDAWLVLLFNPNCHRISCTVFLRSLVGIQHEYSLCCNPAFCDSIIFRDASEHPCRVWAGTVAQCLCIVRDKVRVGSSHLCGRTVDGFLGGPLSCVFPTTSCVRRSKRVAIYRIHESLKASNDPRRRFVLILLLHRTCNSWRGHSPGNRLSCIQICGESGETAWRH